MPHLPGRKTSVTLSCIFNAIFRLRYYLKLWNESLIIMIRKIGKTLSVVSSCWPINLFSALSRFWRNLFLEPSIWFRVDRFTIQQYHRLVDAISLTSDKQEVCSAIFFDISQAFDKIWHSGLLYKLRQFFNKDIYLLLKSYLSDRSFVVRINDCFSKEHPIRCSITHCSLLWPLLCATYIVNLIP